MRQKKSIREILEMKKMAGVSQPAPNDVDEVLEHRDGFLLPSQVIGLLKEDAIRQIVGTGMTARITRENDELFVGTCDFRNDRINLEIVDGKVTNAAVG